MVSLTGKELVKPLVKSSVHLFSYINSLLGELRVKVTIMTTIVTRKAVQERGLQGRRLMPEATRRRMSEKT